MRQRGAVLGKLSDEELRRFLRFVVVEPNSYCWLWTSVVNERGYGLFWRYHSTKARAHRVSYAHFCGEIPEGLFVCHRCDVPACVNPDHLFLGTNAENMADMVAKGRKRLKLTSEDVLAIRQAAAAGAVQSHLARSYDVAEITISKIVRGLSHRGRNRRSVLVHASTLRAAASRAEVQS